MTKDFRLLVVDDDRVTRELLREVLESDGFSVEIVPSGEAALQTLRRQTFPIVLTDIRMVEIDGFAVLSAIQKQSANTVVILMTGFGTMEGAIKAVQGGAFDYISKPFKIDELKALVQRARKHWESLQAPVQGKPNAQAVPKALIGKSPRIVEVYKTLARSTVSPSNVLIIGESGTGKELVARAIHDHSPRSKKKFIAVNCGALAETLLESELFGHMKGAFTGAIGPKSGLFEEADGGTVFLDEVGDVSAGLQVKLLRVLQEGEFKPVGSNETRKTDVRVIAATHRDLQKAVDAGQFREDLYYRLKVILIELPPLRERLEDLPDLVAHFLARYSEKIGRAISHVSDEAMALLKKYSWPGNVRELEHAIEHAITMTRTTVLYPEDFPGEIRSNNPAETSEAPDHSLEDVERSHILRVLEEFHYNKSRAAEKLGIDRKTLHRKAERYGINLKKS